VKKTHHDKRQILKETTFYTLTNYLIKVMLVGRGLMIASVLGPTTFGFWTVLKNIQECASFSGLGASNAMARRIPLNEARVGAKESAELQRHTLLWILIVSLLVMAGMLVWSVSPAVAEYAVEIRLMACVFVLAAAQYFLVDKFKAEQNLLFFARYNLFFMALNIVLVVGLLLGWGLVGVLTGILITHVVCLGYLVLTGRLLLPRRVKFVEFYASCASLVSEGMPILIAGAAFFLMFTVSRFLVYSYLGASMAGYFSLASFFIYVMDEIPIALTAVLFPRLMRKFGHREDRQDVDHFFQQPILLLSALTPILIGLLYINMDAMIRLILPDYEAAIPLLKILLLGLFFRMLWLVSSNMLTAFSKQYRQMQLAVVIVVLTLVADVAVIKLGWGAIGVAWVIGAVSALAAIVVTAYTQFLLSRSIADTVSLFTRVFAPYLYCCAVLWFVDSRFPIYIDVKQWFFINGLFLCSMLPLLFLLFRRANFTLKHKEI
jgi:O-antigen/teichoic acid export membrane protein